VAITALSLVQELSKRNDEYVTSTPTAAGTTTTLIDTALNQYFPFDVGSGQNLFAAWLYCQAGDTGPPTNVGVERRIKNWAQSSSTLNFFSGGGAWPTATTTAGTYEINLRAPHKRKLEAINSAVRQLGLTWYRVFEDTSLTTAVNTWTYTIPSADNMMSVTKVELQVATDTTLVGYPYIDASPWNWKPRESTDSTGTKTITLQFGIVPPPSRTIRITMAAYMPDLVNDSDNLAIGGQWQGAALEFIYDWAQYRLAKWQEHNQPAGEFARYQALSREDLQDALQYVLRMAPGPLPGRVIVPGRGTGQFEGSPNANDPSLLGAYQSTGIVNPGH